MNKNLMLKFGVVCAAAACVASPLAAQDAKPRPVGENLVEVTVVGQGEDKEEAMRDAFRKAVERGAGTYLHSQSEVRDFVLIRDTILTRATGFLQSKEVIGKPKLSEDGIWSVKVKAKVSISGIMDAWAATTNLLKQMGRPKIAVFIDERIDSSAVASSTVQTRIENLLLKSGFLLVNREQVEAIRKKELKAADFEGNTAKMQALAKRFGAQLFISGKAYATSGGTARMAGRLYHRYGAEANVKCYRSDTGQLLSSVPGIPMQGLKQVARSAAKQALDSEARQIAPEVVKNILRFWQDAVEGRGEVVLEVSGIKTFLQRVKLKGVLAEIKGVKAVNNTSFADGVANFSIESNTTAEKLAERIALKLEKTVEVTDLSQNVIKAKYIAK
ncbi:MAG: hypothetical protein J7M14_07845 [Planctomycetes bacterium]|nr:hypothetical protein [Planctomycetota bacterium]